MISPPASRRCCWGRIRCGVRPARLTAPIAARVPARPQPAPHHAPNLTHIPTTTITAHPTSCAKASSAQRNSHPNNMLRQTDNAARGSLARESIAVLQVVNDPLREVAATDAGLLAVAGELPGDVVGH